MKNQLLFILFLFPYLGFSQDYLKLFNGDKLNCKIISVSDSMVVFQKNGITKILPEKEVKELFYNSKVYNEYQCVKQDSSTTYLLNRDDIPKPKNIYKPDYLRDGKILTISGGAFAVLSLSAALGSKLLQPPIEPYYYTLDEYLDYIVAVEEYENKKNILIVTAIISGGLSIVCLAVSNYSLIKFIETKNQTLTLSQKGLGLGLCYTFK